MIQIAIFLHALAGLVLLMLAMKRHQQDWLRRTLSVRTQRAFRGSGAAAVALALFVSGNALGWVEGVVTWCGWLTISAAAIVTADVNRARILRRSRR